MNNFSEEIEAYNFTTKREVESILVKNKIFLRQNNFTNFAGVPDPKNGYFVSGMGHITKAYCQTCETDRYHIFGYTSQELRRREIFKAQSFDQLLAGCKYVKCRHCAAIEHKAQLEEYNGKIASYEKEIRNKKSLGNRG